MGTDPSVDRQGLLAGCASTGGWRPPARAALTSLRATQVIFTNLVAPGGQPELVFRLMFDVDALLPLTLQ